MIGEHASKRLGWWGWAPLADRLPAVATRGASWVATGLGTADPKIAARIRHVLDVDEAAAHAAARAYAALAWRTRAEAAAYPSLARAGLDGWCVIDGADAVREAVAGPGAIVMVAHFGQHGLPPLALALAGVPVVARTFMMPDDALSPASAWSQQQRRALEAKLPVRYVRAGSDGDDPEALLASGNALYTNADGWSPDRILGDRSRFLTIGSVRMRFPPHPFRLARKTGARLFVLYLDSSRPVHRLEVLPIGGPDPVDALRSSYEARLRRMPGQFQFWGDLEPGRVLPSAGEDGSR